MGYPRGRRTAACAHVDAEQRAKQRSPILPVALRIAAGAAVTEPDIQVAVGAELDLTAVVVSIRLIRLQQHLFAIGISRIGIVGRDAVAGNRSIPAFVRVVNVEDAVRPVIGIECHAQEALLVGVGADPRPNLEEERVLASAVFENGDSAVLLHDEEPTAGIAGRIRKVERTIEPGADLF